MLNSQRFETVILIKIDITVPKCPTTENKFSSLRTIKVWLKLRKQKKNVSQ